MPSVWTAGVKPSACSNATVDGSRHGVALSTSTFGGDFLPANSFRKRIVANPPTKKPKGRPKHSPLPRMAGNDDSTAFASPKAVPILPRTMILNSTRLGLCGGEGAFLRLGLVFHRRFRRGFSGRRVAGSAEICGDPVEISVHATAGASGIETFRAADRGSRRKWSIPKTAYQYSSMKWVRLPQKMPHIRPPSGEQMMKIRPRGHSLPESPNKTSQSHRSRTNHETRFDASFCPRRAHVGDFW